MKTYLIKTNIILFLMLILILFSVQASQQRLYSSIVGNIIGCVNLVAFVWAMERIFLKKSIALAVSVIVFKWSILVLILYGLIKQQSIDVLGFVLGLSLFIPSLVIVSFLGHLKDKKWI